jgi:hypothetical protein
MSNRFNDRALEDPRTNTFIKNMLAENHYPSRTDHQTDEEWIFGMKSKEAEIFLRAVYCCQRGMLDGLEDLDEFRELYLFYFYLLSNIHKLKRGPERLGALIEWATREAGIKDENEVERVKKILEKNSSPAVISPYAKYFTTKFGRTTRSITLTTACPPP